MLVKKRIKDPAATRRRLLDTARKAFGENGYGATGTEDLVRQAQVTRGALYHHFRDKLALFRAVVEEVESELAAGLAALLKDENDHMAGLRLGATAFLQACRDPIIRRILMLDAPSVLGWSQWREIDARYGLGLLQQQLEAAMQAGLLRRQPVKPLAHVLLGAMSEAGMLVAHQPDDGPEGQKVFDETLAACLELLEGLRVEGSRVAGSRVDGSPVDGDAGA